MDTDTAVTDRQRMSTKLVASKVHITFTRPLSPAQRRLLTELLWETKGLNPEYVSGSAFELTVDISPQYGSSYTVRSIVDTIPSALRTVQNLTWIEPENVRWEFKNGAILFAPLRWLTPDQQDRLFDQLHKYLDQNSCTVDLDANNSQVWIQPHNDLNNAEQRLIAQDAANIIMCFLVDNIW